MLRVQKHHELWSTSEAPSTSVWFLFLRFIKTSVSVLPFFSCFVKTTWRFKSQRELIPILQLLPANWAWLNHERDEEWNIPGLANRLKWNHVKAANLNCGRSGIIWSLKDTRGNLLPLQERPRRAGRAPTRWQIIEEGNLRQTPAEQGSWGERSSLELNYAEIGIITQGLPRWRSRVSSFHHISSSVKQNPLCTSQPPSGMKRNRDRWHWWENSEEKRRFSGDND